MTLTLLDLTLKGGVLMVPIAACSVFAVAVIIDRAIHLVATRDDRAALDGALERAATDRARAIELLSAQRGSVAALWKAGLAALPGGRPAAEHAMHTEGTRQMARAERGMPILGAVIALTPMLGFLGTIVGLIRAFITWEQLGANVEVSNLAGGMYEAMITTAAGLIVAIPGYLFYAILNSVLASRGRALETAHETFLLRFAGQGGANAETPEDEFAPRARAATEPQLSPPTSMDSERERG